MTHHLRRLAALQLTLSSETMATRVSLSDILSCLSIEVDVNWCGRCHVNVFQGVVSYLGSFFAEAVLSPLPSDASKSTSRVALGSDAS